jgi:hypothetical protein
MEPISFMNNENPNWKSANYFWHSAKNVANTGMELVLVRPICRGLAKPAVSLTGSFVSTLTPSVVLVVQKLLVATFSCFLF